MNSPLYLPRGLNVSHLIEHLIPSVVTGMSLSSGPLPSNKSFIAIRCSGNVITDPFHSNGLLLRSTIPALIRHVMYFKF
jgi:hypothetical protein